MTDKLEMLVHDQKYVDGILCRYKVGLESLSFDIYCKSTENIFKHWLNLYYHFKRNKIGVGEINTNFKIYFHSSDHWKWELSSLASQISV